MAGFTEIGETLEETVAREVMEETGIKVKNIRHLSLSVVFKRGKRRYDCPRKEALMVLLSLLVLFIVNF